MKTNLIKDYEEKVIPLLVQAGYTKEYLMELLHNSKDPHEVTAFILNNTKGHDLRYLAKVFTYAILASKVVQHDL